ncbi:hypothetical protein ACGFY7_39120 [Streptomyces prunicolor]|uniref:hypothetical protein n=1 Tax=Streptomyces prunicolor TaxID=67348 RepID=UPI003718CF6F
MTRSADIDFTFNGSIDVSVTLHALLAAGVRPSGADEVAYVIDEDGMFDWQRSAASGLDEVISRMADTRWTDRVVGVTLLFPEVDCGGDFLFHPGRTSLSCVINVNPKYLPDSSRFCDIGWYLERLVPLLDPLGLSEIETRDSP